MYVLQILWPVVTGLAVLLHTVAFCFLVKSYKGNLKTCQHTYLINLSIVELFKNIKFLTVHILYLVLDYGDLTDEMKVRIHQAAAYLFYIGATSSTYCYLMAMYFLTGDRLCAALFLHRYKVVCTIRKSIVLIIVSWFLCYCVNLPVSTVYYFTHDWRWMRMEGGEMMTRVQLFYIPTVLGIGFVVFGCFTYTVMFVVYARSKRNLQRNPESICTTFVNSNFFISVLLITSFMILMVAPTLVHSYYDIVGKPMGEAVYTYVYTSWYVSDLVDAIIYVLLYKPVRSLLRANFTSIRTSIVLCTDRMQRGTSAQ